MTCFDFFATFDESIAIATDLAASGFKMVPEADLPDEPKAMVFENVTQDLVEMVRRAPAHYLVGAFTRFIAPRALDMLQRGEASLIENQIVPGGAA